MKIGLALCGSFCTFGKVMEQADSLCAEFDVTPIMSENAASTDTRFGSAEENRTRLTEITGKPVITGIASAEPIGPEKRFDVLIVAPCTGNTLAKIAAGITDTTVTMAVKSQLRNGRPVVLALSTNDGLSGSASSLGTLLTRRNIYFVPMHQDDALKKPRSLSADFTRLRETALAAAEGWQIQPLLY